MDRMDFVSLFYSQVNSRESLINGLDALLSTEQRILTIVPYGSEYHPPQCFKTDRNRDFELISTYEGAWLFKLVFDPLKGESNIDRLAGKFFVFQHPDLSRVFLAVTVEPVDFVRRAFVPFIEQNQSQVYLTFIRHNYLRTLLDDFRKNQGYTDLRVVRASLVTRFAAEKGETMISSVSWPRLGLDGTFSYAEEQNGWFRSLTFEALRHSKVLAEATINRNGVIKTDGDFRGIYRSLVLPVCELINDNLKLFAKRSRRENPQLDVKPLTIEFRKEQFSGVEENAKFIDAIRKIDNASVSVVHGNPYIALSIVDYTDGSTFDLWILNPREIVIVPQLKSTVHAIKRLITCVFDNYAEGAVREFKAMRQ